MLSFPLTTKRYANENETREDNQSIPVPRPMLRANIRLNSESVVSFYETKLEIHFEFSRCFLRMFQNGPFINLGTDHPVPEFIPSRSPRLIERVDSKRGTFARGVFSSLASLRGKNHSWTLRGSRSLLSSPVSDDSSLVP